MFYGMTSLVNIAWGVFITVSHSLVKESSFLLHSVRQTVSEYMVYCMSIHLKLMKMQHKLNVYHEIPQNSVLSIALFCGP